MRRRPASSLDLFTDSLRMMGDATMAAVLEFDGTVDRERLEEAFSRCLDAFPILSSRMVREIGPAYWEHIGRSEGDSDVPLLEVNGSDYRPLVAMSIDPYLPSQARVRLLRSAERDVVVVGLAHAASDAYGLMALSRALMDAYRDPSSVEKADDGLPERDTLWTADLLRGIPEERPKGLSMADSMWPAPCGPSKAPFAFHRAVLGLDHVNRIKRSARAHGGTVNDAILCAFFLSMSDLTGHMGPQTVCFPVNLRQHLEGNVRPLSNQAANVCFPLTRAPGEGWNEILDKVIGATGELKEGGIGIREQVDFDRACDPEGRAVHRMVEEMARMQENGLADIFTSNPGPFELPPVAGLTDAYVCNAGLHMPGTCFVVSTFRGSISITVGYQDDPGPRLFTEKLLRSFVKHLPAGPDRVRVW